MARGAKSVGRGLRDRGKSPGAAGALNRRNRDRGARGVRKPAATRPRGLSPASRDAQLRRAASAQDRASGGGMQVGPRGRRLLSQPKNAFGDSPPADRADPVVRQGRARSPLAPPRSERAMQSRGNEPAKTNGRDPRMVASNSALRAMRANGATTGRGTKTGIDGFAVSGDQESSKGASDTTELVLAPGNGTHGNPTGVAMQLRDAAACITGEGAHRAGVHEEGNASETGSGSVR